VSELPLPLPPTSALLTARDQIIEVVDAWGGWESETKGHAGRVTVDFLKRESGACPRAVLTVTKGKAVRVGGGKAVIDTATFQLFICVSGVLEDRAAEGLARAAEAERLVYRSPWSDTDETPDTVFNREPEGGSVGFAALYEDKDERAGMSIWGVTWRQAVDLGPAGRTPDPIGEPLEVISGTSVIPGEPNDDTIETEIT
jgi:hypothetical protein